MKTAEPVAKGSERRRSNRKPVAVRASIISPTATRDSERKEVTSVNISRHGVAFDFHEPLAKQTYWQLDVSMDAQHIACEICIVSCRRLEDGQYQIGAEFC